MAFAANDIVLAGERIYKSLNEFKKRYAVWDTNALKWHNADLGPTQKAHLEERLVKDIKKQLDMYGNTKTLVEKTHLANRNRINFLFSLFLMLVILMTIFLYQSFPQSNYRKFNVMYLALAFIFAMMISNKSRAHYSSLNNKDYNDKREKKSPYFIDWMDDLATEFDKQGITLDKSLTSVSRTNIVQYLFQSIDANEDNTSDLKKNDMYGSLSLIRDGIESFGTLLLRERDDEAKFSMMDDEERRQHIIKEVVPLLSMKFAVKSDLMFPQLHSMSSSSNVSSEQCHNECLFDPSCKLSIHEESNSSNLCYKYDRDANDLVKDFKYDLSSIQTILFKDGLTEIDVNGSSINGTAKTIVSDGSNYPYFQIQESDEIRKMTFEDGNAIYSKVLNSDGTNGKSNVKVHDTFNRWLSLQTDKDLIANLQRFGKGIFERLMAFSESYNHTINLVLFEEHIHAELEKVYGAERYQGDLKLAMRDLLIEHNSRVIKAKEAADTNASGQKYISYERFKDKLRLMTVQQYVTEVVEPLTMVQERVPFLTEFFDQIDTQVDVMNYNADQADTTFTFASIFMALGFVHITVRQTAVAETLKWLSKSFNVIDEAENELHVSINDKVDDKFKLAFGELGFQNSNITYRDLGIKDNVNLSNLKNLKFKIISEGNEIAKDIPVLQKVSKTLKHNQNLNEIIKTIKVLSEEQKETTWYGLGVSTDTLDKRSLSSLPEPDPILSKMKNPFRQLGMDVSNLGKTATNATEWEQLNSQFWTQMSILYERIYPIAIYICVALFTLSVIYGYKQKLRTLTTFNTSVIKINGDRLATTSSDLYYMVTSCEYARIFRYHECYNNVKCPSAVSSVDKKKLKDLKHTCALKAPNTLLSKLKLDDPSEKIITPADQKVYEQSLYEGLITLMEAYENCNSVMIQVPKSMPFPLIDITISVSIIVVSIVCLYFLISQLDIVKNFKKLKDTFTSMGGQKGGGQAGGDADSLMSDEEKERITIILKYIAMFVVVFFVMIFFARMMSSADTMLPGLYTSRYYKDLKCYNA